MQCEWEQDRFSVWEVPVLVCDKAWISTVYAIKKLLEFVRNFCGFLPGNLSWSWFGLPNCHLWSSITTSLTWVLASCLKHQRLGLPSKNSIGRKEYWQFYKFSYSWRGLPFNTVLSNQTCEVIQFDCATFLQPCDVFKVPTVSWACSYSCFYL